MSAATPVPASTMDQKPYEPSMEEILASIRRIIADDQSLPGHGAVSSALRAPSPAPEPVAVHQDQPIPESVREPDGSGAGERLAPRAADFGALEGLDRRSVARQHGSIAAPQFATPDGSFGAAHAAEAEARHDWSTTPVARRISSAVEPHAELASPAPAAARHAASAEPRPTHAEATSTQADVTAVFAADPEPEEDDWAAPDEDEDPYHAPLAAPKQDAPEGAPSLFSAATDTSITSAFNMLAASRLADNSDELMNMVREMIRPLLRSWLDDNLPSMVERMVRAEIERVARGGR